MSALFNNQKKSFFGRMQERIEEVLLLRPRPDEDMLEELEEILITSDIGLETTAAMIDTLRSAIRNERLTDAQQVKDEIRKITTAMLDKGSLHGMSDHYPLIIMVIGVNGSGKTTTIAKLAKRFQEQGKSVMLAAGDTFRAAAIGQLKIWAERIGVPIVSGKEGGDAAGLAFEAVQQATAQGIDILIVDTAGRLQNRTELMDELAKIRRVLGRLDPASPHDVVLVLDATSGNNVLSQIEVFKDVANVTGLVMTKLDGTARGGMLVAASEKYGLPIHAIGVGETIDDLRPFDARDMAKAIAGSAYA